MCYFPAEFFAILNANRYEVDVRPYPYVPSVSSGRDICDKMSRNGVLQDRLGWEECPIIKGCKGQSTCRWHSRCCAVCHIHQKLIHVLYFSLHPAVILVTPKIYRRDEEVGLQALSLYNDASLALLLKVFRSEERRVGKECR